MNTKITALCTGLSALLLGTWGCVDSGSDPGGDDGETGDAGDGDTGDGDDDTGDGDDETGDGDDDTGDGDGDGDDDGGDGDGDGDAPYEEWCQICVDPVDGSLCNAIENLDQDHWITISDELEPFTDIDVDEVCTVISVTPTQVDFDCPSYDPTVALQLDDPWTPNLDVGETVRVRVGGWETDWGWNMDWRVDHADETFAIGGAWGHATFETFGFGAIAGEIVDFQCTPVCEGGVINEQVGLHYEADGEEATLFTGNHAVVSDREIWVIDAHPMVCDEWGDSGDGVLSMFASAVE